MIKSWSVQIPMRFFLGLSGVLLKRMNRCGSLGEGQWRLGYVDSPSIARVEGSQVVSGNME